MTTAQATTSAPAWCVVDHHAEDSLGDGVHTSTPVQVVPMAQLGGADHWALAAELVRYDAEPGFPAVTHEIAFSAGGTVIDLPDPDTARHITGRIAEFAQQLLALADQLDREQTEATR